MRAENKANRIVVITHIPAAGAGAAAGAVRMVEEGKTKRM